VQAPLEGQSELLVHVVVPFGQVACPHWPPLTGQVAPVLHPFGEQGPFPAAHGLPAEHSVAPSAQVLRLQTVQSLSARQMVFGALLQARTLGQSVFLVQVVVVVLLHVPPTIPQSLAEEQSVWSLLQWPTFAQSDCLVQAWPLTLQVPDCAGQVVLALAAVQLALVMLQVPGSAVHTGGAQFGVALHGFSGSGGRRLQPTGLYMVVQTAGWQVCVPGTLHTCGVVGLQVCGEVGQVWDVPLQVWAFVLPHVPPPQTPPPLPLHVAAAWLLQLPCAPPVQFPGSFVQSCSCELHV